MFQNKTTGQFIVKKKKTQPTTRQLHSPSRQLILNEAEAYLSAATRGKGFAEDRAELGPAEGARARGVRFTDRKGREAAGGGVGAVPGEKRAGR